MPRQKTTKQVKVKLDLYDLAEKVGSLTVLSVEETIEWILREQLADYVNLSRRMIETEMAKLTTKMQKVETLVKKDGKK